MDRPNDAVWLLDPERAAPEDFERALLHWDELDETSRRALSSHPLHGRRLDALQLAEAWLEDHLESDAPPAVAHCPDSEELYDYARGPGARPLAAERRAQLDRHLVRCRPCESAARGLAMRPPAPIEDLPRLEGLDAVDRELVRRLAAPIPVANPAGRPALLRWAPLAAAASLVAVAAIGWNDDASPLLPETEPVRGLESGALVSPAGPVLSVPADAATALLPAGATVVFELAPREGATRYAAEVFALSSGALDAGERVRDLSGTDPLLGALQLPPGRYTWRAFATVNGLDVDLGAREFEVVRDEAIAAALRGADAVRAIAALHEAGFRSDARRLARALPAGEERDRYLDASR